MLLVDESSWNEMILATDFVDMLFEEHHIVEIVLNKALPFHFESINVLPNILFECSFRYLLIKIFPAEDISSCFFTLPCDMLSKEFGLRDKLLSNKSVIDSSSVFGDHKHKTFE